MADRLPKLGGRGPRQETKLESLAGRAKRSVKKFGRRKTQAQTESEEIFSHFTLNKDPEASKYMPYDEVAYPSLLRKAHEAGALQESAPEELEAMWMSGHLDYLRRTEMKQVAASMRPFLELPGSTMLPGAAREQRRLEKKKRIRAREEERDAQQRKDRDFLGFPKKRHQLGKKRHEMLDGEGDDGARAVDPHGSLSEQEELRLKHLAKKLLFPPQKVNPYARTNRQLRRAAKTRRPRRIEPTMRCDVVSVLVNRYQEEAAAADVVARAYRHYRRRELLKLRLEQNRVVVCIQTCARGYIARSLVALWHRSSIKLAVKWQARIRRALVVRDTNRLLAKRRRYLVTIHRAMRGFTGRIHVKRKRWNMCALRIQVLWRGARGRCVADRRWLDAHPIPIQRRVRGVLSRARFERIKAEVYTAALSVSRCFRGFSGRRLRNTLLYERESEALQSLLRLLASEAEQMTDKANKVEKRALKRNLREKAAAAREAVAAASEDVVTTESRYLLLISESERCTPRAIASGFRDGMKGRIIEHRKMITNAKSKLIFTDLIKMREAEAAYESTRTVIARARFLANEANLSRDCELKSIWARESRTHHDTAALNKRRGIGDQKRNWRVTFFNAEGKPRKRSGDPRGIPPLV